MEKKVAKGLLAAVVVFSNVLSTTNIASASKESANLNALTLTTEEAVPVKAESDTTAVTGTAEETNSIVKEESSVTDAIEENVTVEVQNDSATMPIEAEDTSTVELDQSSTEDASMAKSEESITKEESSVKASASINTTNEVKVSSEKDLADALINGNKVILERNITLSKPLEITSKENIFIDGAGYKIILNENSSDKKDMFVLKYGNGIVIKDLTFESYYSKAVNVYKSKNIFIENVTLIGQDINNSHETRSNIGIDLNNSQATVSDIVSRNHKSAGIRLINESELTIDKDGWNEHTNDVNDLQVLSGTIIDENRNYTVWNDGKTVYKVKTKKEVRDLTEFKEAITVPNSTIVLVNDIEINEKIEIASKSITIDGYNTTDKKNHQIKTASSGELVVKSENVLLKNLTFSNDTYKPGLTLYSAKDIKLSDIKITGKKKAVALDIYNTNVELTNITCSDSLYRDFQVRGGSTVTLLSQNAHSAGVVHIQTIQKTNESPNKIIDASSYYNPGVEFEENGEKKVDYFFKVEVSAENLDDLLANIKYGGTVITLKKDIKVDPANAANLDIEVGRSVIIDGAGYTLDLNGKGKFILKGKDIVVKDLNIINSPEYGINIYNSKNTILEKISVKNSKSHGIFVNGSTVELCDFTTSSNGAEGIKVTRARTLNSSSHFDSEVKVTGSRNKQEESDIDVIVVNLDINNQLSDNKFIPVPNTYNEHVNEVVTTDTGQEQIIDYTIKQGELDVTDKAAVFVATGQSIELDKYGVVDNTENLKKLIEYAASHSIELKFPAGTYKITGDIDLSELNLPAPAASNFKLTGAPNDLSIIDGSTNSEMLKIFNSSEKQKMSYVNFENLVFNNVGIAVKGKNKKSLALKNNVFVNGKNSGEMEAYIEVQLHGKNPVKNDPTVVKTIVNKIDSNIFLRGANNLGEGIVSTNSENIEITNNFFGNLEGIEDAKQMLPDTVGTKLDLVKDSYLTTGEQGHFHTTIISENDTDALIQNNYFNLVKDDQESEDNPEDGNIPGDEDNSEEGNVSGDEGTSGGGSGPGGEEAPGEGNGPGGEEAPGGEGNIPGAGDNSGEGNGSGDGKEETFESTDDTINKPTTNEQEAIETLPQTSEVFNRVLTALGIFLILSAGLILMKRSRSE